MQAAWAMLCDYYHCPESVRHTSSRIATAVLATAARASGAVLPPAWWTPFWPYASEADLVTIVAPLLALYAQRGAPVAAVPDTAASDTTAPSTAAVVPSEPLAPRPQ